MYQRLTFLVPLAVLLAAVTAQAGSSGGGCSDPCAAPCGDVQYVQKTIYTPQWVTESRKVLVTEYEQQQREVVETVYRCVPEVQQVQRSCTVMVPEVQRRVVPYTYCKPVPRQVERQYTVQVPVWTEEPRQYQVMVPHVEVRQGVRQVCKWIEEEVTHTVQKDCGYWEVQMVQVPCRVPRCCRRGCGSCCDPCCVPTRTVCQRCWVPNIVQEDVTVTVCRPQIVEEPCEYRVTVCKPEIRQCMVKVCHMQTDVRTVVCTVMDYERVTAEREVAYTVCVPREKTWVESRTTYRQVPEEVRRMVTVCVPRQVEREVDVQVCHMVAQTVDVPVRCVPCCRPCRPRRHCL